MAGDDGFREIQLDTKQLVFLFMATTVVAVVIFLCGVMVGRGVRNNPAAASAVQDAAASAIDNPAAPGGVSDLAAAPTGLPATPPPADDQGSQAAAEPVKRSAEPPPAVAEPVGDEPAPPPPTGKPAPAGSATAPYVVQVAAYSEQNQAEALARRLLSKGYAAYVLPPPSGAGMFRVRVGKFTERREAEAVVRRLTKEEQLPSPWITR